MTNLPSAAEHSDLGLMASIERAVAHSLRDFVDTLGAGAVGIDVAGGVAAFTGAGSPLTTVKGTAPQLSRRQLDAIESFFHDHRADATIETAPWTDGATKRLLHERGYSEAGHEDVVATVSRLSPDPGPHRVEAVSVDEWPDLMRRAFEQPGDDESRALADAAARLPRSRLYGIRQDDRWMACAQSALYGDVAILGCDATLPGARQRGAQTALIRHRLHDLPAGITVAAEVEPGSGSERNYLRAGFHVAYTRTTHIRAFR